MRGLPPLPFRLYFWIRERMDFTTGRVGDRPNVSWHGFTEDVEVEPQQGMRGEKFSIQQVRRAARHLVRRNLIKMRSRAADRQLIFECVLADRDSHVRKKADRSPTDSTTAKPDRAARTQQAPKADRGPERRVTAKPDQHPGTGSSNNHYHVGEGTHTGNGSRGGGHRELICEPLSPSQLARACEYVKGLNDEVAQKVLDELAGMFSKKLIHTNWLGVLHALVASVLDGSFRYEHGEEAREVREREMLVAREAEDGGL